MHVIAVRSAATSDVQHRAGQVGTRIHIEMSDVMCIRCSAAIFFTASPEKLHDHHFHRLHHHRCGFPLIILFTEMLCGHPLPLHSPLHWEQQCCRHRCLLHACMTAFSFEPLSCCLPTLQVLELGEHESKCIMQSYQHQQCVRPLLQLYSKA